MINPLIGGWDIPALNAIFDPEDVSDILTISVCDDMEDRPAWHFDKCGVFSVKAAYRVGVMCRDRKNGREAACSRYAAENSVVKFDWSKIWNLNAPNKLKMFVWRLAHNSLANRMKINRIGIELDTRCPVCNELDEDGGHIFLKCKKVKECSHTLGLNELRLKLLDCTSTKFMLEKNLELQ